MSLLKVAVNSDDHILGKVDAPITLVEYGDYQCPHCRHAERLVKQIRKHFGDRLRLVFRNFPLSQIHPEAQSAAETAEFAATQGRFWEMHDLLLENQDDLGEELYEALAAKLDLDPVDLHQALENETYTQRVRTDFSGGVRSGVNGTPTFFIHDRRFDGPLDFETLSQRIEESLQA